MLFWFIISLFLLGLALIVLHSCIQVLVFKWVSSHVIDVALIKSKLIKGSFLNAELIQWAFVYTNMTTAVLHIFQALAQAVLI